MCSSGSSQSFEGLIVAPENDSLHKTIHCLCLPKNIHSSFTRPCPRLSASSCHGRIDHLLPVVSVPRESRSSSPNYHFDSLPQTASVPVCMSHPPSSYLWTRGLASPCPARRPNHLHLINGFIFLPSSSLPAESIHILALELHYPPSLLVCLAINIKTSHLLVIISPCSPRPVRRTHWRATSKVN